jgi:TolB protein
MNADGSNRRRLTRSAAAEGGPTWSPDGRKIAFERSRGPYLLGHVYVMNADGSGKRKLARGYAPRWSPDGATVLFARGGFIHAMNADGSGQRRLARGDGAQWSPDGETILFVRGHSTRWSWSPPELRVMNADGSGQRGLGLVDYYGSTWSPDGRKIVLATGAALKTEIYVMNADGSVLQRLTRLHGRAMYPVWSPAR